MSRNPARIASWQDYAKRHRKHGKGREPPKNSDEEGSDDESPRIATITKTISQYVSAPTGDRLEVPKPTSPSVVQSNTTSFPQNNTPQPSTSRSLYNPIGGPRATSTPDLATTIQPKSGTCCKPSSQKTTPWFFTSTSRESPANAIEEPTGNVTSISARVTLSSTIINQDSAGTTASKNRCHSTFPAGAPEVANTTSHSTSGSLKDPIAIVSPKSLQLPRTKK
jgi:hypothetical protein